MDEAYRICSDEGAPYIERAKIEHLEGGVCVMFCRREKGAWIASPPHVSAPNLLSARKILRRFESALT